MTYEWAGAGGRVTFPATVSARSTEPYLPGLPKRIRRIEQEVNEHGWQDIRRAKGFRNHWAAMELNCNFFGKPVGEQAHLASARSAGLQ
jgi:hypothetical protein